MTHGRPPSRIAAFVRTGILVPAGILVPMVALLCACGTTTEDRALSGVGAGAATGAGIGLVAGGIGVVPGALIGGAAGGGLGALTDAEDFNLGTPLWRR